MSNLLKRKTASGFVYAFAERASAQGIRFFIELILARILMPEEYGIVALVLVFITICDVFVTYGFGSSLIANKNADSVDFSTCFYFGLFLSIVVYCMIFFTAPYIANFYDNEVLISVIRVMGLRIPFAAVNSVQHAYVSKLMKFKLFFYASLIGTIASGVLSIIMAFKGFGVWALVGQNLGNVVMNTICLWFIVDWKPTLEFSWTRLKKIYSYGWKILVVGLIDTIYSRLRDLIVGKKYPSQDLAYYTKGYSFPSLGIRLIEPTVNTVLFPALSQCQDDQEEMRSITRKVVLVCTYLLYPFMIGLVSIAKPLVVLLLTEKWLPCVIFLQIGCIANMFRPQQFINNCVIKASGNSGMLLKLDIIKKIIGLFVLLVCMQFGIVGIALSIVIFYFISMMINIAPNRKILNYGYWAQSKDVFKNLIPALIMGVCIYPLANLKFNIFLIMVAQILLGAAIYLILSYVFKNESFFILKNYLSLIIKRKK
jgi:O-antigen/teichoic acid export membrane protein